jgi:hypothetical protein
MNHKTSFACGIMLAMAVILAACATPQATPCPTSEPQVCPTTAAETMTEMSSWRWTLAGNANAILTFEPGDKCFMQVVSKVIGGGRLMFDVVVNDNAYQNYVVWIVTLDAGKTLEDMKKLTDPINPPYWLHLQGVVVANPMSRTTYADVETVDATEGPIYFTCQVEGPVARKFIDHLGPLEFYATP